MPNPNRLKIMRISRELLVAIFQLDGTRRLKFDGMPADAAITGVSDHVGFFTNQIAFKVASDSFPEVVPGQQISELTLAVEEIEDTAKRGREFI